MKKYLLPLATIITASASSQANGINLTDKVYAKANVSIGYSWQKIESDFIQENVYGTENTKFRTFDIGIGLDAYYKLSNVFHPFIGLDFQGRVPIKTDVVEKHWTGESAKGFWKINDFFSTHLKLGVKTLITKKVAISPYGLIGFNLIQSSSKGYVGIEEDGTFSGHSPFVIPATRWNVAVDTPYNLSKIYVGLSTGVGLSFSYDISDSLSLFGAVEYQYHMSKSKINSYHHLVYDEFVGGNDAEGWATASKIRDYQLHQMSIKFGVQFL